MKIGGPKPPAKPPVDTLDGKPKAKEQGGASFAEKLSGSPQAAQASATAEAARPTPAALDQLVADLRSGALEGPEAARELIQRVVAARAAELAPELREQLKQALERVLENDPTLAAKLRRLGEAVEADR